MTWFSGEIYGRQAKMAPLLSGDFNGNKTGADSRCASFSHNELSTGAKKEMLNK